MNGRKYFLSDGEVYQSAAFSDLIKKGVRQSLDATHQKTCPGVAHRNLLRRVSRKDDGQDVGPEQ